MKGKKKKSHQSTRTGAQAVIMGQFFFPLLQSCSIWSYQLRKQHLIQSSGQSEPALRCRVHKGQRDPFLFIGNCE